MVQNWGFFMSNKKYTSKLYIHLPYYQLNNFTKMGDLLKTAVVVLVALAVYDMFIKKMLNKAA